MTTQAGMSGALPGEAAQVEQQRAEQHFRDHVDRHLPRNARAFLIHGMLGMTGFHHHLSLARKSLARGERRHGARYWRAMNELPTLLMVAIVLMVIVKPF